MNTLVDTRSKQPGPVGLEPVPGPMSASSKCRRRTRRGTTPHTTQPAPGPPRPKCRTRRSSAIDKVREIARSWGPEPTTACGSHPPGCNRRRATFITTRTSPTTSLRCAHAAMNQRSSGAGEGSARVVRCGVGPPTHESPAQRLFSARRVEPNSQQLAGPAGTRFGLSDAANNRNTTAGDEVPT